MRLPTNKQQDQDSITSVRKKYPSSPTLSHILPSSVSTLISSTERIRKTKYGQTNSAVKNSVPCESHTIVPFQFFILRANVILIQESFNLSP